MRNIDVYDLEILSNCFTCTSVNVDNEEMVRTWVIWKEINQIAQFIEYLESKDLKQIGYNNIGFDYQFEHYILSNKQKFLKMNTQQLAIELYFFAQELVNSQFPPCPAYKIAIPQRDLYLIHHFNNKNKAVSLKALQIAMHWPNVMDSPFDWTAEIETHEDLEELLKYNLNDSLSTRAFYWKSQSEINLRLALTDKFGIDLRNASDSKIGQEVMLQRLSKKLGLEMKTIRGMGTNRPLVAIKDVILPFIYEHIGPEFHRMLDHFEKLYVTDDPDQQKEAKTMSYSMLFDNLKYDFGVGGLHAARPAGVYEEGEGYTLESADVVSYYPSWIIEWGFAPEQFGSAFVEIYTDFRQERKLYKKGTPENSSIKLALNGNTGKLRDKYSPLRDTKANLQITINGQICLAILAQWVTEAGGTVIMVNTDGLEFYCPNDKRDAIKAKMKVWESITRMELEYKSYKKMFIRDVNNYIGVYADGTTYNKGAYEWEEYDDKGNKKLGWHKDHSMLAVPRAVQEYLVNRIPFMETFRRCDSHMFFIGKRAKTGGKFEIRSVEGSEVVTKKLNKTVRYYISKRGGYLFKVDKREGKKKKETKIDAPWKITSAMEYDEEPIHENLDYRFYEKEAHRLVQPILNTQISAIHGLPTTRQNYDDVEGFGTDRSVPDGGTEDTPDII
jgi:hypothetical protein